MPEAGPAEHELLRQSVRDFATDTSPETEVRRLMATPHGSDRKIWSVMASQPGLQSMAISDGDGWVRRGQKVWTQNLQRVSKVVSELLGPRLDAGTGEWGTYAWTKFVLAVPGIRISAGTDATMRNILAEGVPGLPREKPSTRNQERT